jgi:protein tyrosine/serine phosphatase
VPERERHLEWEGCFNVRDLGGLPTADGGETRHGAVVRADALSALTARGWEQLVAHGVRTVVDLRNEDEWGEDVAPRPGSVQTIRLPLDQVEDREFWAGEWENGPQFATPLYYGPHLERFPAKNAEVIAAIANAQPGGVAFHCAGGRDRSGQVAMLVLALVGVPADQIAADYELSAERLPALYRSRGEEDQGPMVESFLRQRGTTAGELIAELIGTVDHGTALRRGGLADADLEALRARLLA